MIPDDKPAVTIGTCVVIKPYKGDEGHCELHIKIDREQTPGDIWQWLHKNVIVAVTTLTPADKPGKVQEEVIRVRKFGGRTLKVMK